MNRPETMPGALTYEEWAQLEADLFDNAGEALERVRGCARTNGVHLVPFLLAVIQHVLSSLPGGVTFDAGKGAGCLNLFTVWLAKPGGGKDRMMGVVRDNVQVGHGLTPLEPAHMHLGSGEGVIEALATEGDGIGASMLFGASEVGTLATRMGRQGSTLRGTLLDIYSGNSLGVTTRGKVLVVPAKSYTAGLWVAAQPDKAHLLLDGADDGLRHRFVWTELLDPGMLPNVPENRTRLLPVSVPEEVIAGEPISFPDVVKRQVWEEGYKLAAFGISGPNAGHRTYTRLKVAAGLALLRSTSEVTVEDWKRAGVLMDYSDRVQAHALSYAQSHAAQMEADRLDMQEEAREVHAARRAKRGNELALKILEWTDSDAGSGPGETWSKFKQSLNSRFRKQAEAIGKHLEEMGGIVFAENDSGAVIVQRGYQFNEALEYYRTLNE